MALGCYFSAYELQWLCHSASRLRLPHAVGVQKVQGLLYEYLSLYSFVDGEVAVTLKTCQFASRLGCVPGNGQIQIVHRVLRIWGRVIILCKWASPVCLCLGANEVDSIWEHIFFARTNQLWADLCSKGKTCMGVKSFPKAAVESFTKKCGWRLRWKRSWCWFWIWTCYC